MPHNKTTEIYEMHFGNSQHRQALGLIDRGDVKDFEELATRGLRMYAYILSDQKSDYSTIKDGVLVSLSHQSPKFRIVGAGYTVPIKICPDLSKILVRLRLYEPMPISCERMLAHAISSYLEYKTGGLYRRMKGEDTYSKVQFIF